MEAFFGEGSVDAKTPMWGASARWAVRNLSPGAHACMNSISRYEQLLRMCYLLEILSDARRPLSTAELKDGLVERGVGDSLCDRTVRRDLGFLESFGYPLRRDASNCGGRGKGGRWSLDGSPVRGALAPPPMSLPEVLALLVARDYLAPLAGTLHWRGLTELLARAERQASPALIKFAKEHRDGVVVHPAPGKSRYRARLLAAVNRSIRNTLELEILYQSVRNKKAVRRRIQPESMVVYDSAVYVAAYPAGSAAEAPAGLRFFKLDRLHSARVTTKTFERRAMGVAELLADSITLFRPSSQKPRKYRLVVAPERAKWACEKPFHPGQRVTHRLDGSVLLEIDRAWDGEMLPQLLGLAQYVEILEPEDVRAEVVETAKKILAVYDRAGKRESHVEPRIDSGRAVVTQAVESTVEKSKDEHLVS